MQISVIMSVYKEPIEWLRMSIESILNQTYRDFQFIIVCDNPLYEEGIKTLKKYEAKDTRVKLLFNEVNIGLTKSLNRALAAATGKYVARMDADDVSALTRFERQISYMELHPDVIVLGTNIRYIGDGARWKMGDAVEFEDIMIKAHMLSENCIAHSSVLIRKSALDRNGITYDESYRQSQDYRLWEMIHDYGKFACLKDKLLRYRLSAQQITSSSSSKQKRLANGTRLRLQKNWLNQQGIVFEDSVLEHDPYNVLCELRKHKNVINTPEYRMFVHFVYMNTDKHPSFWEALKNGDLWALTIQNKVRLFINMVR